MDKENQAKTAWLRFVEVGELMPGVRPVIARSWFRCRKSGLNPYQPLAELISSNPGGETSVQKQDLDLEMVQLVLQKLHGWFGIDEGLLVFATLEGMVLARQGGLSFLSPSFWPLGETLKEEKYGTVALALVSPENPQEEVRGSEHYLDLFHQCHSLAITVEILAETYILGLLAPLGQLGKQGVGLLKAGGEILQLQLDRPQEITPLPLLERQEIIKALKKFPSFSQAAEALGISRSSLERKLDRYGLITGDKEKVS